jgi:iron transport multicopper oxidase
MQNFDSGPHPIHTHGHAPQHLFRGEGIYDPSSLSNPVPAPAPARRDTWFVYPGGYTVSRFKADNPGVWFVHCHMDWHLVAGMAAVFVEGVDVLQSQVSVPAQARQLCQEQGINV